MCVAYRPNHEFGWKVQRLDADEPGTQWRLELVPLAGGTRLRFAMRFGPGSSRLTWNIDTAPERETEIIRDRQNVHRTNMQRCAEGIVALAEEAASA